MPSKVSVYLDSYVLIFMMKNSRHKLNFAYFSVTITEVLSSRCVGKMNNFLQPFRSLYNLPILENESILIEVFF